MPGDDVHDQCLLTLKASIRPTLPHALVTNLRGSAISQALPCDCSRAEAHTTSEEASYISRAC